MNDRLRIGVTLRFTYSTKAVANIGSTMRSSRSRLAALPGTASTVAIVTRTAVRETIIETRDGVDRSYATPRAIHLPFGEGDYGRRSRAARTTRVRLDVVRVRRAVTRRTRADTMLRRRARFSPSYLMSGKLRLDRLGRTSSLPSRRVGT